MPVTCDFNQGSKLNTITGITEHDVKCGKPAANYRCHGALTSLIMPLCEYHKNLVVERYKWTLEVEEARAE